MIIKLKIKKSIYVHVGIVYSKRKSRQSLDL